MRRKLSRSSLSRSSLKTRSQVWAGDTSLNLKHMDLNKNQVMAMMKADVGDNLNLTTTGTQTYANNNGAQSLSCWSYWQDHYYPQVIRESYPVYIRERAEDKGKQAYEIIKILKDKKLVNLSKVENFIDLMDELIKIL